MKRKSYLFLATLGLSMSAIFTSCDPKPTPMPPETIEGWSPVYNNDNTAMVIKSTDPINIDKGGKIYVKDNTLYQVEVGKGIHVMDITDPQNPTKVKFIQVLGAQELAIKNDVLYTNNINDLVVLDIANMNNVQVVDRISNVFNLIDPLLPPSVGYFECADPAKGTVVGWELKELKQPKCIRN